MNSVRKQQPDKASPKVPNADFAYPGLLSEVGADVSGRELYSDALAWEDCLSIECIAAAFEQELRSGNSPTIEEYLTRLDGDADEQVRSTLSRILQQTKVDYQTNDPQVMPDAQQSGSLTDTFVNSSKAGEHPVDASVLLDSTPSALDETYMSTPAEKANAATGDRSLFADTGYEVLEEIARGGMGIVYRARQNSTNRVVALKTILASEFASAEQLQRFQSEAVAAAKLTHPGIVPIYEVGMYHGQPFFSMGFVDGDSLAVRLREGPLPQQDAGRLILQVAEAVAYAHQHGVIHRDLKPGNVLLDADSQPHVTDFGLAKQIEDENELTTTGQVLGTPSYMPPEQATGDIKLMGPQSDVYSLGAVLYATLTGRPPFQAPSVMETLEQVTHAEPVSPRILTPTVSRDLETICLKCLSKEPGQRYADAAALVDDLRRWTDGTPILARPISTTERTVKWIRRHPAVAALIATSVLAAAGIGAAIVSSRDNVTLQKSLAETEEARRVAEVQKSKTVVALGEAEAANTLAREADYYRRIAVAELSFQSGDLERILPLLFDAPAEMRQWEWRYQIRRRNPEQAQFSLPQCKLQPGICKLFPRWEATLGPQFQ